MIALNETRERFLLAIAQEVSAASIEEMHFFAPLRQSGVESGVAVVAASLGALAPPSLPDAMPHSPPDATRGRFAVYTARYRLVLKGPDRGKWETNVVAEADAPLVTVEAVVRGVQRRSGDVEEAERYSGEELRELLATKAA